MTVRSSVRSFSSSVSPAPAGSRAVRPVVALVALLAAAALPAQQGVRLVAVPDALELPAAPGTNPLLECDVPGAPQAVWLAAVGGAGANGDAAADRVPLAAAGGARFQVNLADPRVGRIAQRPDVQSLCVVADFGGRQVRSAPIAFVRAAVRVADVRCEAWLADVAAPRALPAGGDAWLLPRAVERLVVATDEPEAMVVAHLRGTDRPLVRDADGAFVLAVDAALAASWQEAEVLELVLQRRSRTALVGRLRAVPERLAAPRGGATFAVVQRARAEIPGSRGFLQVRLGDITGGAVLLSVHGADGTRLVAQRLVRERDRVEVPLAGGAFALVVDRLENLLIGDDFAELRAVDAAELQRDPITELLHCIESSPPEVRFVRGNREFDGRTAGLHVRRKLAALGREPTVDEFVDSVASASSTDGSAYRVRLPDGRDVTMQQWLREQRQRLDAAARERPAAGAGRGR